MAVLAATATDGTGASRATQPPMRANIDSIRCQYTSAEEVSRKKWSGQYKPCWSPENVTSPLEFFELGDKDARHETLRRVLQATQPSAIPAPDFSKHWFAETGCSFSSGNSFATMFIATFFVANHVSYISTRRLWNLRSRSAKPVMTYFDQHGKIIYRRGPVLVEQGD